LKTKIFHEPVVAFCVGNIHTIVVALNVEIAAVRFVWAVIFMTTVGETNPVPLIVTVVFMAVLPVVGLIPVTVGAS